MDGRGAETPQPLGGRKGVGTAADILVAAFGGDPAWNALLPNPGARRAALKKLWNAVCVYARMYGEVWTTSDGTGAICLIRPGYAHVTAWRELRSGIQFGRFLLRLGPRARRRFLTSMPAIDRLHRRLAPHRHAYLWAVGVLPESRRRGTGSALVTAVLARVDALGVPCYLETDTEHCVAWYRRYGFDVVGETKLPGIDIHVWAMVRPARAPGG